LAEQRSWSLLPQPLRDAAAEHHVTDQCHFHPSPPRANTPHEVTDRTR
jgi:hypothetical protein